VKFFRIYTRIYKKIVILTMPSGGTGNREQGKEEKVAPKKDF
jgi:hypothetical protein